MNKYIVVNHIYGRFIKRRIVEIYIVLVGMGLMVIIRELLSPEVGKMMHEIAV